MRMIDLVRQTTGFRGKKGDPGICPEFSMYFPYSETSENIVSYLEIVVTPLSVRFVLTEQTTARWTTMKESAIADGREIGYLDLLKAAWVHFINIEMSKSQHEKLVPMLDSIPQKSLVSGHKLMELAQGVYYKETVHNQWLCFSPTPEQNTWPWSYTISIPKDGSDPEHHYQEHGTDYKVRTGYFFYGAHLTLPIAISFTAKEVETTE